MLVPLGRLAVILPLVIHTKSSYFPLWLVIDIFRFAINFSSGKIEILWFNLVIMVTAEEYGKYFIYEFQFFCRGQNRGTFPFWRPRFVKRFSWTKSYSSFEFLFLSLLKLIISVRMQLRILPFLPEHQPHQK